MDICPCGSGVPYDVCCRPLIRGEQSAKTAEQLMRSRYSAYVKKEIEYIFTSLHTEHRADYDEKSSRAWAESAEWQKFEIVRKTDGGPEDREGEVEFIALYTEQGIKKVHHELSTFKKEGDAWYFVSGKNVPPKQVVRAIPKTGRNDPCICGSNKKYKKCCGR
jgi:SEC-C motif-containing protein